MVHLTKDISSITMKNLKRKEKLKKEKVWSNKIIIITSNFFYWLISLLISLLTNILDGDWLLVGYLFFGFIIIIVIVIFVDNFTKTIVGFTRDNIVSFK